MVEIKGYRGKITGNAAEWRLASGYTVKSPIPLANKKAKVLRSRFSQDHLLQHAWVEAIIVLSDNKVNVKLKDDQSGKVLHLDKAVEYMTTPTKLPVKPNNISNLRKYIEELIRLQFKPLHRQNEIGDYLVLETIEKNRLYTSYFAKHKLLKTIERYLLKVYDFNIYASIVEQKKQQTLIQRDAEALSRLGSHRNIAAAMPPFYWQDNRLVLPMRWVDGFSLRSIIDENLLVAFSQKLSIARQIGEGLSYAHKNGIIHRNLHPKSVRVLEDEYLVKLVDFDYSHIEEDDMQTIATRFGRELNPHFIAPELFENVHKASIQSDIYAWGIILFELFTGELPYKSIREIYSRQGLPNKPTDLSPELSPDLDEIILQMCAFLPEKRYISATDVLEDLAIIG